MAPQAIVANDTVLPMGAECDSCNSRLGRMDNAFLHYNRIRVPVFMYGVPGKRGRYRKQLGHFVRLPDNRFGAEVPESCISADASGGSLSIQLPDPPQFDDLKFRRGLYHMAFNYVAYKRGVDYALGSQFDHVRQYIRYAPRGAKWDYAQTQYPDDQINRTLSLSLVKDAPGLVVRFVSYFDEFSG